MTLPQSRHGSALRIRRRRRLQFRLTPGRGPPRSADTGEGRASRGRSVPPSPASVGSPCCLCEPPHGPGHVPNAWRRPGPWKAGAIATRGRYVAGSSRPSRSVSGSSMLAAIAISTSALFESKKISVRTRAAFLLLSHAAVSELSPSHSSPPATGNSRMSFRSVQFARRTDGSGSSISAPAPAAVPRCRFSSRMRAAATVDLLPGR